MHPRRLVSASALLLAGLLLLPTGAYAQDLDAVIGVWETKTEVGAEVREGKLEVRKTDAGLAASLSSARGSIEAKSISFADGVLRWSFVLPQLDNEEFTAEAKVNGDSFEGAISTPFGDAPIRGTRAGAAAPAAPQPAAAVSAEAILGDWITEFEVGAEVHEGKVEVRQGASGLEATLSGLLGTIEGADITYDGSVLRWTLAPPQLNGEKIAVEVTITGDTFAGSADSPFGPVPVRGRRPAAAAAQVAAAVPLDGILGKWVTEFEVGADVHEGSIDIRSSDAGLAASLESPLGSIEAGDLSFDGSVLRWSLAPPQLNGEKIMVEVTVEGEKFAGNADSPFGPIPVRGRRPGAAAAQVAAAVPLDGILGKWVTEFEVGADVHEGSIDIRSSDAGLAASLESPLGSIEAGDLSFDGSVLRWSLAPPQLNGEKIMVEVTVEGEKFAGNANSPFGPIPVRGRRPGAEPPAAAPAEAPAAIAALDEILGDWTVYADVGGDEHEGKLELRKTDLGLAATFSSPELGSIDAATVAYENGVLRWSVIVEEFGGEEISASVTIAGNAFSGTVKTPVGDAPLRGTKDGAAAPSAQLASADVTIDSVLGEWNMLSVFGGREIESKVTFSKAGDGLAARFETERGGTDGENVTFDNGVISWMMRIGPLGGEPLKAEVKVTGDTFEGSLAAPIGPIALRGRRSGAASGDEKRLLGEWTLYSTYNNEQFEGKLRFFIADDGDFEGMILMPASRVTIHRIRIEGDDVTFYVAIPFVSDSPAEARVKLSGNKFEGKVASAIGDISLVGEMVDSLKMTTTPPYDPPEAILGAWDLKAVIDGVEYPATLTFALEGAELKGTFESEQGTFEAQEVRFNKVGDNMGSVKVKVVIDPLDAEAQELELIVNGTSFDGEETRHDREFFLSGTKKPS